jgi:hypothetical protein
VGCANFAYGVGQWHHVLYRYEGTGKNAGQGADLEIFLDGKLAATVNNANKRVIFSATQLKDLVLGKGTNFWLDDLKVYNEVFDDQGNCEIVIGGSWNNGCTLP